jgi:hypothetical protein
MGWWHRSGVGMEGWRRWLPCIHTTFSTKVVYDSVKFLYFKPAFVCLWRLLWCRGQFDPWCWLGVHSIQKSRAFSFMVFLAPFGLCLKASCCLPSGAFREPSVPSSSGSSCGPLSGVLLFATAWSLHQVCHHGSYIPSLSMHQPLLSAMCHHPYWATSSPLNHRQRKEIIICSLLSNLVLHTEYDDLHMHDSAR